MAFATVDDVATRLGRELTAAEEAMAQQVLNGVTGLIADAADKSAAWAAALTPIPLTLKELCIAKVIAVGANPSGLYAASEQLGAYQHTKTYRRPANGASDVFLSDAEERLVRRVIWGVEAASGKQNSIVYTNP